MVELKVFNIRSHTVLFKSVFYDDLKELGLVEHNHKSFVFRQTLVKKGKREKIFIIIIIK